MSIDTTKQIKKVTYNGTEISLAGGSSSSSGKLTSVAIYGDSDNIDMPMGIMYQIGENEYEFINDYTPTDSIINVEVLIGGIIFIFIDPMTNCNIYGLSNENIIEYSVPNSSSYESNYYAIFKVTGENASFRLMLVSNS